MGRLTVALALCLALQTGAVLRAATPYSLTVLAGGRQTLTGFGASQVSTEFGHFAPEPFRTQMAKLVYRDLGANIARLWVQSGTEYDVAGMKDAFYADYADSEVLPLLAQSGVTTLLLAPARGPEAPEDSLPEYAAKLAAFIAEIQAERGIEIAVTGIANEPDGWTGEQLAETIKCLRSGLDARGLAHVEIIAPEGASANELLDAQLDRIRADPLAWKSLRGIASHSYNMAARDSAAQRASEKVYWMTEASDDGNEQGEDENRAATIAARFLNDMNHRVTHWIYFKGFSYSPDVTTDNYTASRLTQYDARRGEIVTHLKYHYLKALRRTFDLGAIFRRCESSSERDMVYTYGQKPKICAAAAVNPDGSWGLGIVNLSGVGPSDPIAQFHPAEELSVTVQLPEIADSPPVRFHVWRCKAGQTGVEVGLVEAKEGRVSFPIGPRELVCLRAVVPAKKSSP